MVQYQCNNNDGGSTVSRDASGVHHAAQTEGTSVLCGLLEVALQCQHALLMQSHSRTAHGQTVTSLLSLLHFNCTPLAAVGIKLYHHSMIA